MIAFLSSVIKIIHILTCLLLTVVVLLQAGRGGMGAAFGGGGGSSVFGGSGAAPFLTRFTAVLAGIFMTTSMSLAWLATRGPESELAARQAREIVKKSAEKTTKLETDNKQLLQDRKSVV